MTDRIYDKDVLEFVTVATELCVRLEKASETPVHNFVGSMLKILPLLYVKALLVKDTVSETDEITEKLVSEDDYEYVRVGIHQTMGAYDDYLDVFVEDMKYSDKPIRKTISEDLADIYQDVRNFIGIYQEGYSETMAVALSEVMANFTTYWGQRLVNVLRALHDCMFQSDLNEEENL